MDGTAWLLNWLRAIAIELRRIEILHEAPEVHQMPMTISKRMLNPVEVRSSCLAQVAYDIHRAMLQVTFRDGAAYQYAGVSLGTYQKLLQADSKGAYFNQYIRNRYPHAMLQVEVSVAQS